MTIQQRLKVYAKTQRVLMPFLGSTGLARFPRGAWDIWAPVFSWQRIRPARPSVWFELHQPMWWKQPKSWRPGYAAWLKRQRIPVLMQRHFQAIPASVRYPKEDILNAFPGAPFHGTFDWMMALAIFLQVKDIAVWGLDFGSPHQAIYQKTGGAYWIGRACGEGIHVIVSPRSSVFSNPMPPKQTYGYDYPPWPHGHHPKDWPKTMKIETA